MDISASEGGHRRAEKQSSFLLISSRDYIFHFVFCMILVLSFEFDIISLEVLIIF